MEVNYYLRGDDVKQKLNFKPLPGRDKLISGNVYWIVYEINETKYPHFAEARWDANQDAFWFWSDDNIGVRYDGVYGYLEWDEIEIEVVDLGGTVNELDNIRKTNRQN